MSEFDEPRYGWVKRYGIPVLYFDPMPYLGPYINQRAMFGGIPRPVEWWPTNWLAMPIIWIISFTILVRNILRGDAS